MNKAGWFCLLLIAFLSGCGGNPSNTSSSSSSSSNSSGSSSSSSSSSSSGQTTQVTTVIEEGDRAFCPFSGAIESDHIGFKGNGYANGINALGSKLTWSISIDRASNYAISIRYANGGLENRPANLSVNQQSLPFNFAPTAAWTDWQNQEGTFNLPIGTYTFTLEATTTVGLANIDSISFRGEALVNAGNCPANPAITVWIAGDSTVANGNTPCPVGWGKTIGALFNDKVTIQNLAVGGRSVRTWLYDVSDQMGSNGECNIATSNGSPVLQGRWTSMLSQMQAGDYFLIQFGINDGATTCPRHVGTTTFYNEYIYMANEAIKRGAHPIVITPAPALKCSGSTAVSSRGFILETFSVARQLNIPVIDLHQLGTDLYNQLAFCPVAGGDVSASTTGAVGDFFCDDHTHFDTKGSQQISKIIANALRTQGIVLSDYLTEEK